MNDLKPCPFCCGTKLKVERKSRLAGWNGLDMRVEMHTYSVRCNTCHARGGAVGGRVMNDPWTRCAQLPDWTTTDKALEAKAIEAWNRRADNVAPVVHTRWAHLGGDEWCCPVCGFVITTEGSWDKPTKKYCEDCGAMMDGEPCTPSK